MRLAQHQQSFASWQQAAWGACWPLLVKARAELVAVQNSPSADEAIDRIESLLNAELEPILIRQERALESIQRSVEQAFERIEEPTEAESAFQEQVGDGGSRLRDFVSRKVNSLLAQARAQELVPMPQQQTAIAAQPRHCAHCGAPLSAQALQARRCGSCGVAV